VSFEIKQHATAMLELESQEEISFNKLVVSTLYRLPMGVRNTTEAKTGKEEKDELRIVSGRTPVLSMHGLCLMFISHN
jgi:hypothetical protein